MRTHHSRGADGGKAVPHQTAAQRPLVRRQGMLRLGLGLGLGLGLANPNPTNPNPKQVCMKPDSFEELLSRCSAKFSGGADSEFIARRLFTQEGFELEEAEEVLDGDTVVVSAGEDFIQPSPPPMALQPSLASHSTLSSGGSASELQALASAQEERLLTPRRAESASSCASSACTSSAIPATPDGAAAVQQGALSPPPPTVSPPPPPADEPSYHLAVLQAAPLVTRAADHKPRALPQLNLQALGRSPLPSRSPCPSPEPSPGPSPSPSPSPSRSPLPRRGPSPSSNPNPERWLLSCGCSLRHVRLQAERHTLTEVLRIAGREISITFETATTDALRTVVPMA